MYKVITVDLPNGGVAPLIDELDIINEEGEKIILATFMPDISRLLIIVEGESVELVTVPDVTGDNHVLAQRVLEEAGLQPEQTFRITNDLEKLGLVFKQQPSAGSRVARGTGVVIVVGAGESHA